MDADDQAYRKSARNMAVILVAMAVVIFAAIFIPPYLNPVHSAYLADVSYDSPFGFVMHLEINSTSIPQGGGILLTGWLNSSSSSYEPINASDSWAFSQDQLWGRVCTSGWPIGLGLMRGHYTQDNYTLGTLIRIPQPLMNCPFQPGTPSTFLFNPHSSEAVVTISGTPALWVIQSALGFGRDASGNQLSPGVYTAVLADEWGDVLATNFLVT